MQIRRIYSSKPDVFHPIAFNCGATADRLNVVYGEVRHPADQKRDSHNLGKTTLLYLIDFMFLKGTSQEHFLVKNKEQFDGFVFFMEVLLNSGDLATIRRGASAPSRVGMTRHAEAGLDFQIASDDGWDHPDLSIDDAIRLFDGEKRRCERQKRSKLEPRAMQRALELQ